jgi:hypothetical protein
MKLRVEVKRGSVCNFAAVIVKATVEATVKVEVKVEVSVLEVFSSSQLTSLVVIVFSCLQLSAIVCDCLRLSFLVVIVLQTRQAQRRIGRTFLRIDRNEIGLINNKPSHLTILLCCRERKYASESRNSLRPRPRPRPRRLP